MSVELSPLRKRMEVLGVCAATELTVGIAAVYLWHQSPDIGSRLFALVIGTAGTAVSGGVVHTELQQSLDVDFMQPQLDGSQAFEPDPMFALGAEILRDATILEEATLDSVQ